MATILTRPTNGVSYGVIHTITATDVSDDLITIDFQNSESLVASVIWTDVNGNVKGNGTDTTSTIITYPADGQVALKSGTGTWVAGDILHVICQTARIV